jgi:hypothetical protein
MAKNKHIWFITLVALVMMTVALLAREAEAQEADPLPTMLSTSWALTPGWTPTLRPWPPLTPSATPTPPPTYTVYLPMIGGE